MITSVVVGMHTNDNFFSFRDFVTEILDLENNVR
jgi:hypothetical protein